MAKKRYVRFIRATSVPDTGEDYGPGQIVEFSGNKEGQAKVERWLKRVYCEEATEAEYQAQFATDDVNDTDDDTPDDTPETPDDTPETGSNDAGHNAKDVGGNL